VRGRAPAPRLLPAALVALLLVGGAASAPCADGGPAGGASPEGRAPLVAAVTGVDLSVANLDRALAFYTGVLGFARVGEGERAGEDDERLLGVFGMRSRWARLRLGEEEITLTEFLTPAGRPMPVDARANDLSFQHIAIVVADLDRAYTHLRAHNVAHASTGPQVLPEWNPDAGGIGAFYFRDPDGHFLEVIHFPPGKGDERWRRPSPALFLGIDHTAIVVSDTERSLAYYRDVLGMRVAGASENYGPEQERLNNVFGARLRITALRSAAGPGVELLEYLSPSGGRPAPPDTNANDVWSWRIEVRSSDLPGMEAASRRAGGRWLSPGVVPMDADAPWPRALHFRDPDGHAQVAPE
jgi:catechol 2,3-dioxygenase-like lactoylglutathione lyase family enzyme